jgi:hypothetical protein
VLTGRERREVQLALEVLDESVAKLKSAEDELSPAERELAEYYLERIDDLQAFFQVAALALETVLGSEQSLDFEEITKIDIG